MKVLITGHLGYIGTVMVGWFKQAGHQVVGLDVGYFRDCLTGPQAPPPADLEIERDIRDVRPQDLDGVQAVIHLAALSNDPLGELDPDLTHQINHAASVRLARLAKENGVSRFVFASSCSLYGAAGQAQGPLSETAPFNPVSAYAQCKVKTEQDLSALADKNFSPVYLRNSTAFGVSPRMRFDLVLNNLMAWAQTTGTIKVLSDGTPWRPLVHIEDISRAALAAVEAPSETVHDQAFNIGRNEANYQVVDIAQAVAQTVPGSKLVITGQTSGDPRSYRVDFTKALTGLPGFEPQWTLERGCRELAAWFKEGRLGDDDFDSRRFIHLKQLQHLMASGQVDDRLRPVGRL
ncbi:MAG: NAD-dependent epimerase/dehydratase family protein [Deltaproteobacteria bacterium]|nr:NAD-dependent epimerase/dehydratase family protein [Deltaproteobacteria bacterium]